MIRIVSPLLLAAILASGAPAHALKLSGTVYKSNAEETVAYDLTLGDAARAAYRTVGTTSTDKGYWKSSVDYSKILTFKEARANGKIYRTTYRNDAVVRVYPQERRLDSSAALAGIRVEGGYKQGSFDDGLWLEGLIVGGVQSRGALDYNSFNQRYHARQDCSFGSTAIRGTEKGSALVADYDRKGEYANQMRMTMRFGSLVVKGRIRYQDTEQTTITDLTHRSTEVVGTTGHVELDVTRADGSDPVITLTGDPSPEEKELRRLIAFLELFAFDMWSE